MSENVNKNTKVGKSVSLTQGAIDDVTNSNTVWSSYDFSYKVQSMIEILHSIINYTRLEIKGIFTKDEAKVICDTLNGMIFTKGMSPILQLYHTVNDAMQFTKIHQNFKVDPKQLGDKLLKLTAAQAFAVCTVAIEYWNGQTFEDKSQPTFEEVFGFLYEE